MELKKMVIIGANGSAYKRTIPALKDSKLCVVTAIQSRNEEKLRKTCEEYGIPRYYTDMKEMLKTESFDLIYIANPPFLHKESIAECIQVQKPIICEKPLAQNYDEALEIKTILEKRKVPFMVAHHLRHQKAFCDLKNLISSKRIGDVISVWGQWGFEINQKAASSIWKLNKENSGGGTLNDNGIHVIDFLLALFGNPKDVVGKSRLGGFTETFSNEFMIMMYQDKEVIINSSHTMPCGGNHLLIYGTDGSLEIEGAFTEKSIRKIVMKSKMRETILEYEPENLYKNEVENFIRIYFNHEAGAIQGTTLDEAVYALKLVDRMRSNQIDSGIKEEFQL